MNRSIPSPLRVPAALALAGSLTLVGGCSSVQNFILGDKVDYKAQAAKTAPLDVPPDLTQLARDGRYRQPGGVVSASGVQATPTAAAGAAAQPLVAPKALGDIRVERQGSQRWLVVPLPPEQLWPQLQAFWRDNGFTLEVDSPQTGIQQTTWTENRAKIPQDFIRSALGRVFDSLYSPSERDLFRTRVERTESGSEVYISHRGMEEGGATSANDPVVKWRPRASDPQLEAEMLTRLMLKLGARPETTRTAVAAAAEPPPRARPAATPPGAKRPTSLQIDDGFDRAWRRVGLALDRSGFTVEDRDRAAGVYFVRYIDPANLPKDDPNLFQRIFGNSSASNPVRYRVLVRADGEARAIASVQNSQGQPETGEAAQTIIGMLITQLR